MAAEKQIAVRAFFEPATDWKARALDRSLADARRRADTQLTRLIDAAQDLIGEQDGAEFTVQELVARAGMSTRTFYRHFAHRDELLLAVLEEEVRRASIVLHEAVAPTETPLGRLRAFVEAYVALPTRYPTPAIRRSRTMEWTLLSAKYPDEIRRAFAPMLALLVECLRGVFPDGPSDHDLHLTAESIRHLLTGHLIDVALAGSDDAYERITGHAWRFCCGGLGLDPEDATT